MKTSRLFFVIALIAVGLFLLAPGLSFADDAAAGLFKTKCSTCHGANAEGKPAMHAPGLVSDEVKKMSDGDLTGQIADGAKSKKASHAFSQKGVSADQVKSLVGYIRELNKK